MKFALIAAVVLLALAQGSFADVGELEKLSQYFEELKNKMTQELTDIVNNRDLANQAQTFLEERKTQLEPLAAQLQDQLRSAASNIEEHIKPVAENVQAQIQPMVENFQKQMEAFIQRLSENTQPIGN